MGAISPISYKVPLISCSMNKLPNSGRIFTYYYCLQFIVQYSLYLPVQCEMMLMQTGFRNQSVQGRLRLREFFIRSRLRLLVKENKSLDFLKLTTNCPNYVLTCTCTSTCRSYFMLTLEKMSNTPAPGGFGSETLNSNLG